jgi:hypothetical protein
MDDKRQLAVLRFPLSEAAPSPPHAFLPLLLLLVTFIKHLPAFNLKPFPSPKAALPTVKGLLPID